MFLILLSLKLILYLVWIAGLVLDFVPDTKATVVPAYEVYTVTDLRVTRGHIKLS